MQVSGVQSSSMAYGSSGGNQATALATKATDQKATEVKDQIAMSVIKQAQDQQQVMAEGLMNMMQSTLDIYA